MKRPVTPRGRRPRPYVIDRPEAIRLLASPLRQAMVDVIAAEGPLTVAQLSRRLRRPADRLYYHVKRLAAAGLLVEWPGDESPPEAQFAVPGRPMYIRYRPDSVSNRRAVTRVADAMLRAARRDFARGFRAGVQGEGRNRRLWASRAEGNLTAAEISRLNRLLSAALELVLSGRRRADPKARPHQLTWISSPVVSPR